MQRREWLARPEGICQACKNKSQSVLHWRIKSAHQRNTGYTVHIYISHISRLVRRDQSKISVNKMKRCAVALKAHLCGEIKFMMYNKSVYILLLLFCFYWNVDEWVSLSPLLSLHSEPGFGFIAGCGLDVSWWRLKINIFQEREDIIAPCCIWQHIFSHTSWISTAIQLTIQHFFHCGLVIFFSLYFSYWN